MLQSCPFIEEGIAGAAVSALESAETTAEALAILMQALDAATSDEATFQKAPAFVHDKLEEEEVGDISGILRRVGGLHWSRQTLTSTISAIHQCTTKSAVISVICAALTDAESLRAAEEAETRVSNLSDAVRAKSRMRQEYEGGLSSSRPETPLHIVQSLR